MKKSIFIIGCLALLMAGCNKVEKVEVPAEEPVLESPNHLIVDFKVNQEGDTRSVKTSWEAGDKIYVFFDHFFLDYLTYPNIVSTSSTVPVQYMTLTYNGVKWNYEMTQALEQYLLNQTSGTLIGVYYSKLVPEFRALHGKRGTKEEFLIEVTNGSNHSGYYMYADNVSYAVANGKLTATLNMHLHERGVRFFVPSVALSNEVNHYLKSDQVTINSLCGISSTNNNDAGFQPASITLSTTGNNLKANYVDDGAEFYGRLVNSVSLGENYDYVIQVVDQMGSGGRTDDDICYTLTKTTTLYGKDAILLPPMDDPKWVRSFVNPLTFKGFDNNHEWVMMGDGLRWATMNVGAADKNDPGDFLYWPDGRDGAKAWGDNWRMPTKEEWEGLLNSSSQEINPVYDTVDGQQVFTGVRITVLNNDCGFAVQGNELFLPAAGSKNKTNSYSIDQGVPNGYYWTSHVYWQGSIVDGDYVLFTPETPYFSFHSMKAMADPTSGCLLVRPVLKYD